MLDRILLDIFQLLLYFFAIAHSPKFSDRTMSDPRKLCPGQVRSMWQDLAKKLVLHGKVKGVAELAAWIGGFYPSISGSLPSLFSHTFDGFLCLCLFVPLSPSLFFQTKASRSPLSDLSILVPLQFDGFDAVFLFLERPISSLIYFPPLWHLLSPTFFRLKM